jgi:hypothetical protein
MTARLSKPMALAVLAAGVENAEPATVMTPMSNGHGPGSGELRPTDRHALAVR